MAFVSWLSRLMWFYMRISIRTVKQYQFKNVESYCEVCTNISVHDNSFRVTYENPESDVSTLFLCSPSNSV